MDDVTCNAINPAAFTRAQRDAVESLSWAMEHFGSLHTNRQCSRKTVLSLVALGIAESIGMCQPCDGDGFIINGRKEREGFKLTEYGQSVHRQIIQWYEAKAARGNS